MRQLVFDIETTAFPFDSLSESQQEYILRASEKLEDEEERKKKAEEDIRWMALWPFTAKVIAIGMYDVQKEKGYVYYEQEEPEEWVSESNGFHYKGLPEKEIVESFWRIVDSVDQVVTFNGRGFDNPFMHLRSAILKVKPTRNLMGYRYDTKVHVDLLEQFSYYGAYKKFNLDFYCHAFGVTSPKSKGVSGMEVQTLYEAGKIKEIAAYCGDDIYATYELFKIWKEYLNVNAKI